MNAVIKKLKAPRKNLIQIPKKMKNKLNINNVPKQEQESDSLDTFLDLVSSLGFS